MSMRYNGSEEKVGRTTMYKNVLLTGLGRVLLTSEAPGETESISEFEVFP